MTLRVLMTADAVGGVWQYATELAAALQSQGVETVIAVLGPAPSAEQLAEHRPDERTGRRGARDASADACDVRVVHTGLPLDWLADGPEPVLAAGQAVADLAARLGVDLVHLNSPTLAAGACFDQPVVAVPHGCIATWWQAANGCDPDPDFRWQAELMRRGLLAADATVAPSASFAEDLRRTYTLPTTPIVVHNGRSATPLGQGTPANHVLTAGRLWDRVKGTAVLDRVAERLSVPLRAAGPVSGPHGETVSPRHLELLGNLSGAALAAELASAPVFVSAATFEPFGLAVLEAAQAGCALVLSDIPTFRELWDGAALFVPADNDAVIAAVLEELLADPIQRQALGESALRRAARYTPRATASAMATLYAELAGTSRKAAA